MRLEDVLADGVRIDARHHHHSELLAAMAQLAEGIAIPEEGAAVMHRDLRRIVGDDAAGAETDRVAMRAFEVVEPVTHVQLERIVLDESQLAPAHRAVVPGG